jgi:hypothetical protein
MMKKIIIVLLIIALYPASLMWKAGVREKRKGLTPPTISDVRSRLGTPVYAITLDQSEFRQETLVSGFFNEEGEIVAQVSPQTSSQLKVGQVARISRNDGSFLNGRVSFVSQKSSLLSGLYEVKISFESSEEFVGKIVVAEVAYKVKRDVNVVPRAGVLTRDGETFAFVVKDGVAKKVLVQIAESNHESYIIKEGISFGDILVVSDQRYLKDGDRINLVDGQEL